MDYNILLSIVGVLVAVFSIFLSVYYFKSKKYPGNITYFEEESLGLFDSLVKNFSQISIKYNNENINEQIVLLKGSLLNTGSVDIKQSMVEKELTIELPEKYKWLNAKIVDSCENSKSKLIIDKNRIIFDLGLFRKNEFIRFEALVETPEDKDAKPSEILSKDIAFTHRIADTNKIENNTLDLKLPKNKKRLIPRISIPILFLFYIIASILLYSDIETDIAKQHYVIKTEKSDTIEVNLYPKLNKKLKVISLDKNYIKEIEPDEFFSKYFVKSIILEPDKLFGFFPINNIFSFLVVILLVSFCLSLIPLLIYIKGIRKIKRVRSMLNLPSSASSKNL